MCARGVQGLSNLAVARYLVRAGLPSFEGVVFLDECDAKNILLRKSMKVVPLAQSGIPKDKRFSFYDQVGVCTQYVHAVRECMCARSMCTQ